MPNANEMNSKKMFDIFNLNKPKPKENVVTDINTIYGKHDTSIELVSDTIPTNTSVVIKMCQQNKEQQINVPITSLTSQISTKLCSEEILLDLGNLESGPIRPILKVSTIF